MSYVTDFSVVKIRGTYGEDDIGDENELFLDKSTPRLTAIATTTTTNRTSNDLKTVFPDSR